MKLWLIKQKERTGWDTFDSCVVAAETADIARTVHPNDNPQYQSFEAGWCWYDDSWASSSRNVTCWLLGQAIEGTKTGLILASFNAG